MPLPRCVKERAEQQCNPASFPIQRDDDDSTPDYSTKKDIGLLNSYRQKISKGCVYKKSKQLLFILQALLCLVLVTKKALVKRLQGCALSLIGKAIAMHSFQIKHPKKLS